MRLTWTASYSRTEPPTAGEPPQKKLRVSSDSFREVRPQPQPHPTLRTETPVPVPIPVSRGASYLPSKPAVPPSSTNTFYAAQQHRSLQQSQSPVPVPNYGNPYRQSFPLHPSQSTVPVPSYGKLSHAKQAFQSPVTSLPLGTPLPVQPSQSPVPIPRFGKPANPSQLQAILDKPPIAPTQPHVPVSIPPSLNNHVRRDSHLPPAITSGQRKLSNSPIPIPTLPEPSLAPSPVPQSQVSQLTRPTSSHPPQREAHPSKRSRTTTNVNSNAPTTPLRKKSQLNPTSPQNFRTRAHALALRKDADAADQRQERPSWASLTVRPYQSATVRQETISGTRKFFRLEPDDLQTPTVFHVDFSAVETEELLRLVRRQMGLSAKTRSKKGPRKELMDLLREHGDQLLQVLSHLGTRLSALPGRSIDDINAFLFDLKTDLTRKRYKAHHEPVVLSLERDDLDLHGALVRSSRVTSLLYAREVGGQRGYGSMRRLDNYTNEFRKCWQDDLELRAEWTNCAGDITTITWLSNDGFICGTTNHSDAHNQQYNKAGNLVLGSCSLAELKAYPDHRIVRPVVEKGENSTDAMRQSQSPWLYTSVVESDYDERHDRAYTCGFDRTVKVWKANKSGASMDLLGTWYHEGNVNFVAVSKHESGMVATTADVPSEAVRIYHVDDNDIARSPFRAYSCSRVVDLEGNAVSTEKWAYFPAAINWARCAGFEHLVAVGYSPRSRTGDDNDIPEDRRGSGEICVWDGLTGEKWHLIAGSKLNVFEILWHPTQLSFVAATSPQGKHGVEFDARVRSQIRIYVTAPEVEYGSRAFSVVQVLDCTAVDINEITIMPNSARYSYVTAACTDGKAYVWDTALGDKPIHVLEHGMPIDEFNGDREAEDTGVKFCAWGTTPDRFYTGSSDGVVKVWNVRTKGKPRPRDLLEVPGPVSYGKFSPDMSKLIIGDATGRVFFLSVDEEDRKPFEKKLAEQTQARQKWAHLITLPAVGPAQQTGRRETMPPQPIISHPEPAPPAGYEDEETLGASRARAYLASEQLRLTGNAVVGAVQGPKYAETGLFRRELHANDDPAMPLLSAQERLQQHSSWPASFNKRGHMFRPLPKNSQLEALHERNIWLPLDALHLTEETKAEIREGGRLVEIDCYDAFKADERFDDFRDDEWSDASRDDEEGSGDVRTDEEVVRVQAEDSAKGQDVEMADYNAGEEPTRDAEDDIEIMELSEQEWRSSMARRVITIDRLIMRRRGRESRV
ncbi:hypothetical protein GE09DRAFT_1076056 [Coniochaeta sp. 2T2.1]|nr:hypothetical protein GE09DRAFT_1076056 [Coniochaeta sp. 2T2.1]